MRYLPYIYALALFCEPAQARENIAILDLVALDVDATEALLLSQHWRDEWQKRGNVIARADLYSILAQKSIEPSTCSDSDCMEAVGRAAGVQWVVTGSVSARKEKLRIEAQLYRVDQQHVFSSADREADSWEKLRRREAEKLVAALWPGDSGGGIPWWLLVLGGGAATYWKLGDSGKDTKGQSPNPNDGDAPQSDALGAAAIIGIFDD